MSNECIFEIIDLSWFNFIQVSTHPAKDDNNLFSNVHRSYEKIKKLQIFLWHIIIYPIAKIRQERYDGPPPVGMGLETN